MSAMSSHQTKTRRHSYDWITPPEIIDALGAFDLEPCTPELMPWTTAARRYRVSEDGLKMPWAGRVWLNPPWGNAASPWLKKMAGHNNGIALIPARTERRDWHQFVWPVASAILFMASPRLTFHRLDGSRAPYNCGCPTALVAYGRGNAIRLIGSGIKGAFVSLNPTFNVNNPDRQGVE